MAYSSPFSAASLLAPTQAKATMRPPSTATNACSPSSSHPSQRRVRASRSIVASCSAPNTCSYAVCQVRTCTSAIAAASAGRARRISTTLLAGGGGHELRDRVDLCLCQLALEGRHDAAPVLDLVLRDREGRLERVEVRPDRAGGACCLQRVTARALRREDRLAVVAKLRRRLCIRPARAGDGRNVRGDVDGVLAPDEIRRHREGRLAD